MNLATNNDYTDDIQSISLTNEQRKLGRDLYLLYNGIINESEKIKEYFKINDSNFQSKNKCCDNLLCYLVLRKRNIEQLQLRLAEDGLSSLGRLEDHVLISIEQILKHYGYVINSNTTLEKINQDDAQVIITNRSRLLLGRPRDNRTTRIMVTVDIGIAHQPQLLEELLKNGMDIARINCAYDTEQNWKMIIESIRNTEDRLIQSGHGVGRKCRIVMDLAGPKIRIKQTSLGTGPLKITVPKDTYGRSVKLVEGFFDCEAEYTERTNLIGVPESFVISVSDGKQELTELEVGERLLFYDSRGKYRMMTVLEKVSKTRTRVGIDKSVYLDEGLIIHREKYFVNKFYIKNKEDNTNLCPYPREIQRGIVIGTIKPHPIDLEVKAGDKILINKKEFNENSNLFEGYGRISCTMPEVLSKVEIGHRVLIDDGKIDAKVISTNDQYLELEITYPSDKTAKIQSEKGLNFPDSNLDIPAITSQDIKDLKFIVKNATAVGISFAHSPEDVRNLYDELVKLGNTDFGVIAKIENRNAVHNLGKILLTGLSLPKFGVLIARGDLAVEMGFENLSLIQEDILCLCEAAHVPVILATQVLETLAKSGLPTRAEITDAARGHRAECVMLNKGKFIVEAVKILSLLLKTEQQHNIKKRQIFREFTWQNGIFDFDNDAKNKENHIQRRDKFLV
ncbi:MAG TPA: pyruvate kinase [Nitrososphaeraceae archaeon]|nr:pyruvate kinase [Nitrososphaeraceae archaeon]